MLKVSENENSELLKLLLEAKLVDQDMLKMRHIYVSVHETCNVICELKHWCMVVLNLSTNYIQHVSRSYCACC